MQMWENLLEMPDVKKAEYKEVSGGRYFKLRAEPIKREIVSGIVIDGVGYNNSTSAPLLVVVEGENSLY
ncbi:MULTISPECIES: hypothetical protein [Mesobacillus]|uniref:Uncharacterized protein n=1 Tax=Mesobacillus subterraneus TaxID=285983 RepID=A0A0D6ZF20_9BACI|nr:hypothetical protein [Mesobacillus subterraneus]KIY23696.1 hypothetical protein UB32_01595 [Mesobacillus subterraneus]